MVFVPARQTTQAGGIHSLASIPGPHKHLKARAVGKEKGGRVEYQGSFVSQRGSAKESLQKRVLNDSQRARLSPDLASPPPRPVRKRDRGQTERQQKKGDLKTCSLYHSVLPGLQGAKQMSSICTYKKLVFVDIDKHGVIWLFRRNYCIKHTVYRYPYNLCSFIAE